MGRNRRQPLPYDKRMMVHNIRILMRMRNLVWKQMGCSHTIIDNSKLDHDVSLSIVVRVAQTLGVSLDTLIFKNIEEEFDLLERSKNGEV